ncbi:MAG: hypothetical protein MJA29_13220, partial [Candidatus Omnitrophica bacterium]|nr:hypothetical protein [Candidatus Omnitrophota bacterium]
SVTLKSRSNQNPVPLISFRKGGRDPMSFVITHDPIYYFDKLLHNILTWQSNGKEYFLKKCAHVLN